MKQHKNQPGHRMDRNTMRAAQNKREQDGHDAVRRLLDRIEQNHAQFMENPLMRITMTIQEAVQVAMHAYPPQMMAVEKLLRLEADLYGLIVHRTAVKVIDGAGPTAQRADFSHENDPEAIYEAMRERIGTANTERFRALIEDLNATARGDVIEGEMGDDSE